MSVIQFDHTVLVVDEEKRARDFYMDFLGAIVDHTFTREGRVPGKTLHRSLLMINGLGHGLGLFEDRVAVPVPKKTREYATVVFRVDPVRYQRALNELDGFEIDVPIKGAGVTYYTHDSEGNPIGFTQGAIGAESFLLRLEVDIPRLEEATKFYEEVFGLPRTETGIMATTDGQRPYAWFGIGDVGQGILVVEDANAPSENHGHHYAFLLEHAEHLALKENLVRLGVEELEGHEGERVEGEIGTYVMDPGGRKLQWITHADTN
jgi:catechol 2,3-dioxygenase-like lactoylglutathione lyase family enzyme